MRFFILTLGTRGDLELFLNLARALAARGHDVTIGSSPFYAESVTRSGIAFQPVGAGTHAEAIAALAAAGKSDDLIERTRRFYEMWLRPQLNQAISVIGAVVASADAFISNLKLVLRRGEGVMPCVSVTYDPPLQVADLERYGAERPAVLDLVAMNQALVDPRHEWGSRYQFTGFWTRHDSDAAPELSAELETFLAAGPPPVVATLGSMAFGDVAAIHGIAKAALEQLGLRGVFVRGWSSSLDEDSNQQFLTVDEAPYDALFPRCAAVVHHGGVGTLAAVLRAGKPSVILPQVACQRVLAVQLIEHELASGVHTPPNVSVEHLTQSISVTLDEPRFRGNAERWREIIARDGGVEQAAECIERHVEGLRHA